MYIDLHKALERVEENLPKDRRITFEMLEKAYEQTLWLRSHILGVMYDMIDFGSATKRTIGEVSVSQTDSEMKKKILWIPGIRIVGLMMIDGIIRYIEVQKRESDPNWQMAQEIYKVESALKEVDEDCECQSVSKVTPFTYTDSEGNTIVYYCIQTAYLENESGDDTGLDMNAMVWWLI